MLRRCNLWLFVFVCAWIGLSSASWGQSSRPAARKLQQPVRPMPKLPAKVTKYIKDLRGYNRLASYAVKALRKMGTPAVSGLLWALQSGSRGQKEAALDAFCRWPKPQQSHLALLKPALLSLLQAPYNKSRHSWQQALWRVADESRFCEVPFQKAALKQLQQINTLSFSVQKQILDYFGHCGKKAKPSVPKLMAFLKNKTSYLRWFVLDAVRFLGVDSPKDIQTIVALAGPMQFSYTRVYAALWGLGPNAKSAVPWLLKRLRKESSWKMRSQVIDTLGNIGAYPKRVVPVLVEMLNDISGPKPQGVFRALSGRGGYGAFGFGGGGGGGGFYRYRPLRECVSTRRPLRRHSFSERRIQVAAADALAQYKTKARSAGPYLMKLLGDSSSNVQRAARKALVAIGPSVLPLLKKGLGSDDPAIRSHCVWMLRHMKLPERVVRSLVLVMVKKCATLNRELVLLLGKQGVQTLPTLLRCYKSVNNQLRVAIQSSISQMGEPGIKALGKVLRATRDDEEQSLLLKLVWHLGTKGAPAADSVSLLMYHNEPSLRRQAVKTLLRLGKKAVPLLQKAYPLLLVDVREAAMDPIASDLEVFHSLLPLFLLDESRSFRTEAARLLLQSSYLERDAKYILPLLRKMLQHPKLDVQISGLKIAAKLEKKAAPLVHRVIRLAKSSDEDVSEKALSVLEKLGPKAAPALPLVLQILKKGIKRWKKPATRPVPKKPVVRKTKPTSQKLDATKPQGRGIFKAKPTPANKKTKSRPTHKKKPASLPARTKAVLQKQAKRRARIAKKIRKMMRNKGLLKKLAMKSKGTVYNVLTTRKKPTGFLTARGRSRRLGRRRRRRRKAKQYGLSKLLGRGMMTGSFGSSRSYSNVLSERMEFALTILVNLGEKAAPAVPLLVQILEKKAHTHSKIFRILKQVGAKGEPAVPHLIKVLKGKFTIQRLVGLFGVSARDHYDGGGDPASAAKVLVKIGASAKAAIPALIKATKAKKAAVRWEAVKALAAMGAVAKSAVPALSKALTTKTGKPYKNYSIFGRLSGRGSGIGGFIGSSRGSAFGMGVKGFGGFGYGGTGRRYRKKVWRIRRRRRRRLRRLRRLRRQRWRKKARLSIRDENYKIQRAAADALKGLGRHAVSALPALKTMRKDQDLVLAKKVKQAIAVIEKDSKNAPKGKPKLPSQSKPSRK
ncbi:MAG: hypothetical protein EP343_12650 [Deltaproteobacteria bacterium]|nr:MAG: hypothetical protein EP343_12650 [Deltaproteobacteria bacterium]